MIEPIPLTVLVVGITVTATVLFVRDWIKRTYEQDDGHDDC